MPQRIHQTSRGAGVLYVCEAMQIKLPRQQVLYTCSTCWAAQCRQPLHVYRETHLDESHTSLPFPEVKLQGSQIQKVQVPVSFQSSAAFFQQHRAGGRASGPSIIKYLRTCTDLPGPYLQAYAAGARREAHLACRTSSGYGEI